VVASLLFVRVPAGTVTKLWVFSEVSG
jgi:hypothetical protein